MEGRTAFTLKYGTIGDVLKGKGSEVTSYEDLYGSCKPGELIYVPKIVGVFQDEDYLFGGGFFEPGKLVRIKRGFEEFSQMKTVGAVGKRDGLDRNLICLVYDQKAIEANLLKFFLGGDVLRRLKLVGYDKVPNFQDKEVRTIEKLNEFFIGFDIEDKERKERATALLQNEQEYFEAMKTVYGLTRQEAVNFNVLNRVLCRLESGIVLVDNPLEVSFINKVDDLLKHLPGFWEGEAEEK